MQVTDYLSAILVGVLIGVLGRLVLPGRQRIGAFLTFLIGVGAALLGLFLARWLGVDDRAPVRLWVLHWDWIVLAFQVGLAVIGIGLANVLTHTRLAGGQERPRRRPARRRTTRSSSAD
ncbi:GlsB/YeaQ/YmgE family stress response membrane protein [Micromonospora zhanjiangensis]|uniref:GlsB/YeaQ/YmgE family stress response membrane protein n=1 Tax=Micromonospora zhanjiangensis TaxID=1522057 RepID=A0ABV8KS10_9ACTN